MRVWGKGSKPASSSDDMLVRTGRTIAWVGLVMGALTTMSVSATHVADCVPGQADPQMVRTIPVPNSDLTSWRFYYVFEDSPNPLLVDPVLVPGGGILAGEGTFIYEEWNGLVGLQRGGSPLNPYFPPGCDLNPDWKPTDGTIPCISYDADPANDENCHAGPDLLIWAFPTG